MTNQTLEHRCLPRTGQPCPQCGEMMPTPSFCERCGADVTPAHFCAPRPLSHVCPPGPPAGRCLACGESLPARHFCPTCGANITPSHRCKAAPPTHVPRPDPIHLCPALPLGRCGQCGNLLPALRYCENCGVETTPTHFCQPRQEPHHCPPYLVMPRRCSHCGEAMPASQHCAQCGADITAQHSCK